jgi:hypothetical protein
MIKTRIQDSASVLNGFCKVLNSHIKSTSNNIEHIKETSQNLKDVQNIVNDIKTKVLQNVTQNPLKSIVCFFF